MLVGANKKINDSLLDGMLMKRDAYFIIIFTNSYNMAMDYFIFSNAEIWICDIPKEGFWFVNMGSSNLNFLWKWNFYNYWSYCTDRYIIDVLSKRNSCKQINVIDITCQITLVLHGMSYQSLHCRKILCIMEEKPRLQILF